MSETISQTHVNPISNPRYGSVGIPHFGVECRIVDLETLEELPIGKEGELIIKAFIILRPQHKGLVKEKEMIAWAKNKMAAYKYPRVVEFADELPKTGSGKILKRALRES